MVWASGGRGSLLRAALCFVAGATAISLVAGCGGGGSLGTVQIDTGEVSGAVVNGINRFLGIPYAAPPTGALRWQPPRAAEPWSGTRACTTVGPECPQIVLGSKKSAAGQRPQSEDCLYLNVWTPAKKSSEKLPVMFWIHGGAYQLGAGGLPLYNGEKLAERGVVVVTINYRLGPLGFLAHPALTAESPNNSSGNYGLLDQQAAMQWVKRNIYAFGGDPAKVTIFGESAGAMSVFDQLVSPLSAGLFHQAISESGLFIDHGLLMHATRPLAEAESIGSQYASEIGCAGSPDVAAAMRAKPVEDLLSIKLLTDPGLFIMDPRFVPTVDGWVIPEDPGTMVANGQQHDVALLLGSNREEGNLFVFGAKDTLDKMTVEQYQAKIRQYFGAYADQVLAMFPVTQQSDIKKQLSQVFTIFDFTSVSRFAARSQVAKGQKAYLYQFDKTPPAELTSFLGPCHGSELPFVFGTLVKGKLPDGVRESWSRLILEGALHDLREAFIIDYRQDDLALSGDMIGYWTRFAKTGDPNGEGAAVWPAYQTATDKNIELARPISVKEGLDSAACDLADRFYGYVK
ncbi:MAG: carboxylesterase/lipase family protein [Actinomycetota bacterium]